MKCIGINYKKVDIDVREKYSFTKSQQEEMYAYLMRQGIRGIVILSTCNRSEIYFTYDGEDNDVEMVINAISQVKNIPTDKIMESVYVYSDKNAVRHLFTVTAGLDSMILGEDEILRQVKESYQYSFENGYVENEINMTFQGAFNCAKTIKTDTMLSKTPVSYGTLAANYIEDFFSETGGGTVLIIGITGKIGSILAKNLYSKGITDIIGSRRSRSGVCQEVVLDGRAVKNIDFDSRYQYLDEADVIVSATSSPHFTLVSDKVKNALTCRKKRLFIDMAVPHDIDKRVKKLEDCIYMDIDDFKTMAEKNSEIKIKEADKAAAIVDEKADETAKAVSMSKFMVSHGGLVDRLKQENFMKIFLQLKERMSSEQFEDILKILVELMRC